MQTCAVTPFQDFIDAMNREWFHVGDWKFSPIDLAKFVCFPIIAILFARLVKKTLRKLLTRTDHFDPGVRSALVAVTYYVTLLLGLIWAMDQIGLDVTSLAVFTGAVGVGMGLGLQDFAKNFIAGLLMMFTRPVKPGDMIEFSGQSGKVKSIGAYSTIIETAEQAGLLVPNSMLLNDRVVNWTYLGRPRIASISVSVPVNSNLEEISALMIHAADRPEVLDTPPPRVEIASMTDTAVEIKLFVAVAGIPNEVTTELYRTVLNDLNRIKASSINDDVNAPKQT